MASNESTKGYIFATHVRLSNIQNVLFLYGFRYYLLGGPQSQDGQSNIREFNLARFEAFKLDYYFIISCSYSIILYTVKVKMKVLKKQPGTK